MPDSAGGLISPIAGTSWKNNGGYDADSGLDIIVPKGTPARAAADGIVEYAEHGHTPWATPPDTPNSVRIRLHAPVVLHGITYSWIWYTHLSEIDSSIKDKFNVPIKAGAPVGKTGIGNKVEHLHFGVLVDQAQTQTMPWRDIATIIWGPQTQAMP
jgi:murein DD-endopeptidase MepM/ murein hydrolase activator NlpD